MTDVLILPFDGSNGSTTITDVSAPPKTVTAYGDAQISTAQSKYGGASAYFDGAGDYLTIPTSTDFDFGSGDMTVELWFNTSSTNSNATLICREWGGSPYTGGWTIQLNGDSSSPLTIYWADYSTSTAFMVADTSAYRDAAWHHLAWTKSGNVHRMFLDGVQVATATTSTAFASVSKALTIGNDATFGPRYYAGYIDDLRITKGTARYTADFTPPGALVGIIGAGATVGYAHTLVPGTASSSVRSYTTLLLHGDGADGSTEIFDNSYYNHDVTVGGNVHISTAQSVFADSSLYFDGATGSYLTLPISDGLQLSGIFTLEAWVRPSGTSNSIFGTSDFQASHSGWDVSNRASDWTGFAFHFGDWGYSNYAKYTETNLTNNTWQHIAITRDAAHVWRLFVGGVLQSVLTWDDPGTFNNAVDLTNNTFPLTVGRGFTGYISDLRMLQGLALYTENFEPPGYLPGYVDPNETTYFRIKHTFRPGAAIAVATLWPGYKYGDHTTWSFSCNDPTVSAWATEDTGNPVFPAGAIYLTYGASNSATSACFGDTSIFFPAGAYVALPTGAGDVAAYTDFTFECWINKPSGGGFPWTMSGFPTISCNFASSTWTHFAICRKSNILRYYKDGQKFYEALNISALSITRFGGTDPFYLDSVGFSNNYAQYTANDFVRATIPFYNVPSSQGVRLQLDYVLAAGEATGSTITPTVADTQWNRTVLMLGGGGTVGSKVITDAKGRTIYNESDVVYSDAHKKFAQTSLYFNGASALVLSPSRNLDFIDGDFTIELWIYPTRIQKSAIYDKWGGATRSYTLYMAADGKATFEFLDATSGINTKVTSLGVLTINQFSFVSVCRYGNDYRVWINGVGGTVVTTTGTPSRYSARSYNDVNTWDADIVVGSGADGTYFKGYIEDLRVTNGVARYTTELYAPPTLGFLKSGSGIEGDPYWADVKLLTHFDEPNGTTMNIRDARGHRITAFGGGVVASGGLYGNGWTPGASAVGYFKVTYGSEFDLSTGDFTLECWVATSPAGGYLAGNSYGQSSRGWQITTSGEPTSPTDERKGGLIQWTQWDSNGIQDIAIGPLFSFFWDHQGYPGPKGRWSFVCVQRRGNDITIFIDGVGVTTSIARRPAPLEVDWYFGAYPGQGGNPYAFSGYDELRFTKAARYIGDTMPIPSGKFSEQPFSYGAAILSAYHALVPGHVSAASVVPSATIPTGYSVTPPLIIGKPSAEGPDISHSFSVVAADATGGEGIPEDFSFAEALNTTQAHSHAQVIYVNDVAIAQGTKGVTARLGVTDVASALLNSLKVTDTLALADSVPGVSQATSAPTEAVTMSGAMSAVWGVVLSSTVAIADEAQRLMHQAVLDTISFTTPAPGTRHALSLTEALATSGTATPAWHRASGDTLGIGTTAASLAKFRAGVTDATTFDDAPALEVLLYATVSEDVVLDDVPAQTLLFQAIIQDDVRFKAFFASPAYTAWAMNTRNAAVTQYTGFNFNSFAKMGERYLGANDQGLFWLDGDDDDGRTVKSRITTGIIQPNGNKLAGVQYAYLGMRGDGQFVVTVTDEAGGAYNYTLTGSSMETARVAFGRGLKTRYFTFSLESQGQDFDLDSVEFITTEMARKVQR